MGTDLEIIDPRRLPAAPPRLDQTAAAVYLGRLAPGSRRTMLGALTTMAGLLSGGRHDARTLPWHELEYQHTQALRSALASRYAPATANKHLSALRGVLEEAWRLGLMDAEQSARARDLKPIKGSRLQKGRALARTELAALFAACDADETAAGRRDAALLAILWTAGVRRSEAVALDLRDVDAIRSVMAIRAGKGNKDREIPLNDFALHRVAAYLEVRGRQDGALFLRAHKSGCLTSVRLSDQAVRTIILARAEQAGMPASSPHDWRRTFASSLLDVADLATVQALMGHSSPSTTAKYDRRGDERKRRAVDALEL